MKTIVICPDSFKGSLSASEVTECIAETIQALYPKPKIIKLPLADGGEGTFAILNEYLKESKVFISEYHFIESAKVIGLPLFTPEKRNPLKLSSQELGFSIKKAIDNGATKIAVSLGGSATCDGGMGMLNALGFKFLDSHGKELVGNGENLNKIHTIIKSPLSERIKKIKFTAICDVKNPLIGSNGAAYVFAPQKGAKPEDLPILDYGLKNLSTITEQLGFCKKGSADIQGTAAAGGIAFALHTFLNAEIVNGIDFVLDELDFENKIKGADLIITGEGKADRQSLMGKVVSGVLKLARKQNIPVLLFAGKIEDSNELLEAGIERIYEIADPSLSTEQNMLPSQALENIRKSIVKNLTDIL